MTEEQALAGTPDRAAAAVSGRLARFREAKQAEIAALRERRARGESLGLYEGTRPSFAGALRKGGSPLAVVAEYKRASPSMGRICESVTVEDAVLAYAGAGASALSILTEERYFDGDLAFLARARTVLDAQGLAHVPLLRKDFLLDPLQVEATAATPASAFLLIVRQTPDVRELRELRELGERAGMDAVVEIFDDEDLELARSSGAGVIQVNARDLDTLKVDRQACLDLIVRARPRKDEVWIAASGMDAGEHLGQACACGYTAALVGTALMRHGTPGRDLARLLGREPA